MSLIDAEKLNREVKEHCKKLTQSWRYVEELK
jgi:hypothetical protein|nr:MAG TPA: hypothetical protein [Caudoviricetes sp.]